MSFEYNQKTIEFGKCEVMSEIGIKLQIEAFLKN